MAWLWEFGAVWTRAYISAVCVFMSFSHLTVVQDTFLHFNNTIWSLHIKLKSKYFLFVSDIMFIYMYKVINKVMKLRYSEIVQKTMSMSPISCSSTFLNIVSKVNVPVLITLEKVELVVVDC